VESVVEGLRGLGLAQDDVQAGIAVDDARQLADVQLEGGVLE